MEVLTFMKAGRLLAAAGLAVVMLCSCAAAEYHKITAEEAKEILDEGGDNTVLLDVRTEEEFQENRIEGAVLLPDNEIGERALDELPDKNARILVYCRSGVRSKKAANELVEMGYKRVYDFGGILDWPYETVNSEN
jgi:rhodanese-related sulfurtransferase